MPKKGDVIKNYKIVAKIGKGGFGKVFLVESLSPPGEKLALKVLEDVDLNEEVRIGLKLGGKCPYLVEFKEICKLEDEVFIFMEYCDGGDLAKRIRENKTPTDAEIYRFLYESLTAVKALHDAGVIHRDITPSNFFLLSNGGYKLGDYGFARMVEPLLEKSMTHVGADGYIAPEILQGNKTYTAKVDIFSLGVTVMEFILGHNPFCNPGQNVNVLLAAKGMPVAAALQHPHPVMQLALRMIAANPVARPSASEILSTTFANYQPPPPPPRGLMTNWAETQEREREMEKEREKERERVTENVMLKAENERLRMAAETQARALVQVAQAGAIPYSFRPNMKGSCVFRETNVGVRCAFTNEMGWRTAFINQSFTQGIWSWSVQLERCGQLSFGVAPSENIALLDDDCFGNEDGRSKSFMFNAKRLSAVRGGAMPADAVRLLDQSVATLEVNMDARTLALFIDGKKVPCAIMGIPAPLHMGISADCSTCFVSLSLRRLSASTSGV